MRQSYPDPIAGCQRVRVDAKLPRMVSSARPIATASHAHLVAEFAGVATHWLDDGPRLGGLLVAAAGAAGLHALAAPFVRTSGAHGIDAMLLLEGGHAALHAVPSRQLVLVDLLASLDHDLVPAYDVLARRLACDDVRAERLLRG
jgi:S-adenosylmethionine/arginine decarboxylase-like enzyme